MAIKKYNFFVLSFNISKRKSHIRGKIYLNIIKKKLLIFRSEILHQKKNFYHTGDFFFLYSQAMCIIQYLMPQYKSFSVIKGMIFLI